MAEVRLENVTKLFEGHIIGLKDFSLQVKDGEFVTIFGPSGSGKSTALRIIGVEKMGKYVILVLSWQEQMLKSVVGSDFFQGSSTDNLWIEFDKGRLYLFDIATQELL